MPVVKLYEYPQCSTCKDALKFLVHNRYAVEKINIFTNPPTKAELKKMLGYLNGNIKALFNTHGHVFEEMKLKDKLPTMTEDEALTLLSKNGKLVKRPFAFHGDRGIVGYKKEDWKKFFDVK